MSVKWSVPWSYSVVLIILTIFPFVSISDADLASGVALVINSVVSNKKKL